MMHRTLRTVFALVMGSVLLGGASCIRISTGGGEGGVFVSLDRAATWQQRAFVRAEKRRTVTIAGADVYDFAGPLKSGGILYAALGDDGLYRTVNRGEQWELVVASKTDAVRHVALNPKNEKMIYIVIGSRVVRTIDAGSSWEVLYIENRPNVSITDLQVDPFDPRRVYCVFSDGSMNVSVDGGSSWSKFYEPTGSGKIIELSIQPSDTRVITLVTENKGIVRSRDMGATWTSTLEPLKSMKGSNVGIAVETSAKNSDSFWYLSKFGLLQTSDSGVTWNQIPLLTDPSKTTITTFTVDPATPTSMYYTTTTTLYLSVDGGKTWSTKSLPTSHIPSAFAIEPGKSPVLYLGAIDR